MILKIAMQKKTLNRDTEKAQKVHPFGQLICQGLGIWVFAFILKVFTSFPTALTANDRNRRIDRYYKHE